MELVTIHCGVCHVPIHMEASVQAGLRDSHATFYCLNGHKLSYSGPTQAERDRDAWKAKAERAEREATYEKDRAARIEREAKREKNRCEHCPKRFDTPERLRAHIKRIHTKVPRLPANAGESN